MGAETDHTNNPWVHNTMVCLGLCFWTCLAGRVLGDEYDHNESTARNRGRLFSGRQQPVIHWKTGEIQEPKTGSATQVPRRWKLLIPKSVFCF